MPRWAMIFNIWADEPVYHRLSSESPDSTACGREIGLYKPTLPMKHVEKFGRPCRGCFPAK